MSGMVEKRGAATWLTHAGLILGIAVICFPIWIAFVASTVTQDDLIRPPMPLLPGPHFVDNYLEALLTGGVAPVWQMLLNSLVMALGIPAQAVIGGVGIVSFGHVIHSSSVPR